MKDQQSINQRSSVPMLAGALAGLTVDVTMFPIDTIKTRIQSPNGFFKSGGFSRIFLGVGSTLSGSAPSAALFFTSYESGKYFFKEKLQINEKYNNLCFMVSATFGEIMACLIRVPVEVVKQRAQAFNTNSITVLNKTIKQSGIFGLYRGYKSTIIREIPFSIIQFPIWESSKLAWARWKDAEIKTYEAMICGSFSGAISAFLTTPLDVAKTHIMLQNYQTNDKIKTNVSVPVEYFETMKLIFKKNGVPGLFAGTIPRVIHISIGGAIFLGGYDLFQSQINNLLINNSNCCQSSSLKNNYQKIFH